MAEKIKQEKDSGTVDSKKLLLAFYEDGDTIEVVSNVDPWVERDFSEVLNKRSSDVLTYLGERLLRNEYNKVLEVKE